MTVPWPTRFFFNAPTPTEIYTFPYTTLFRSGAAGDRACRAAALCRRRAAAGRAVAEAAVGGDPDRKSTRLNSSHVSISYAVFCLKKKTAASDLIMAKPIHAV